MKAKDTAMNPEDILVWIGLSPGFPLRTKEQRMAVYLTLANRQAEISFKAGIKEVVEWGRETCPHNLGEGTQYYKRVCDTCWQTKLKEWGIDGK